MARSKWKFFFFDKEIYKYIYLNKKKINKENLKNKIIFSKNNTIPLFFENYNVYIYKGNIFKKFVFKKFFEGLKFGNFILTKKPFHFPIKKSKR